MILDRLDIDADSFAAATGWAIKPEGACKGDVCVPVATRRCLRPGRHRRPPRHGTRRTTRRTACGRSVRSRSRGRTLVSAEAPDVVLRDMDGNDFHLASLRGQKVVIVSWAPY